MELTINGMVRQTPELGSVAELAAWLELPVFGSAVELNGRVVRREEHASALLKAGDRLEIVRMIGGG